MTDTKTTPITDAAVVSKEFILREMDIYSHKFVLADYARDMERELAAIKSQPVPKTWESVQRRIDEGDISGARAEFNACIQANFGKQPVPVEPEWAKELRRKFGNESPTIQYIDTLKAAYEQVKMEKDLYYMKAEALHERAEAIEELVRAAAKVDPYLDAIICYASTMDEHEPNRIANDLRQALAKLEKQ